MLEEKIGIVLRLLAINLIVVLTQVTYGQISCAELVDSLQISKDTFRVNQSDDSLVVMGVQWLGTKDLSYTHFSVRNEDSTYIKISGGQVSGGLQSPYPSAVFFDLNIDYRQFDIPNHTQVHAELEIFGPNVLEECTLPITFIVNNKVVSNAQREKINLGSDLYPNPLVQSSILKVSELNNLENHFTIFDINGSVLYKSKKSFKTKRKIQRNFFKSSGVYFIKVYTSSSNQKTIRILVL